MFFNFFKQPEIRQFEHVPIYWNPQKEQSQERLKRVRDEIAAEQAAKNNEAVNPEHVGVHLQRGFLSNQRKLKTAQNNGRTIRLAVIVGVVVSLAIWAAQ